MDNYFEQKLYLLLLSAIDHHFKSIDELVQTNRARVILVHVGEQPLRQEGLLEVKILNEIIERHIELVCIEAAASLHCVRELILEPREPFGVGAHARNNLDRRKQVKCVHST